MAETADAAVAFVDTALLLDRLVSASSGEDVVDSLEHILKGLEQGSGKGSNSSTGHAAAVTPSEIVAELEVVTALLQVLQNNYKKLNLAEIDAQPLAARIYLKLLERGDRDCVATLLQEPAPGRLLETAIDVACDSGTSSETASTTTSAYPRVLALQLLRQLALRSPKVAQSQLLAAPNGLHRLGDLLKGDDNEAMIEPVVRNEALLLAAVLAEWASVAKVWMFSEVGDVVVQTAVAEGGLTGGNVLVQDCLKLLQAMLKHDAALADLVFQSPVLAPNLGRLLDLRGARAFRNPPAAGQLEAEQDDDDDDDDLDDLLSSGNDPSASAKAKKPRPVMVPKLTQAEEKVVHGVFDIFETVLENEAVKNNVWKQHLGLCSLVWEMALLSPPPPGAPWPCGVPSIALQQRALHVVACYFNSPDLMAHHTGLDRLMYLVCTAGGRGSSLDERMLLSQSALHVIRRTLPDGMANEMLLHTLAPPIDHEGGGGSGAPAAPTEVQKLLNTAFDNLKPGEYQDVAKRKLFLAGSLGALGIFLTDEPRRSILLRLTESHSLLDAVLDCLLTETNETSDDFIPLHLLRFLGQWVMEAPMVTQALLNSPHATPFALLYTAQHQQKNVAALTGVLLGLCLEYMGDDESRCGGWTRTGILQLLQQGGGISKFMSQLEKLKSASSSQQQQQQLPWSSCQLEWQVWTRWYDHAVLTVRKRVVQALTAGGGGGGGGTGEMDSDDDDDQQPLDGSGAPAARGMNKTMQRLVAEQANEIEELRASLAQAQRTVTSQEKQLATWKQRVESTPTQLDEMLNEYGSKNTELELKIGSLEDELRVSTEKHHLELKARDEKDASLQQQLVDSRAAETEARHERDTLRGDMEALSQAYSSLEEEYRRQQTAAAATGQDTGSTPAGEQAGSELQQREGEESHQAPSGSTEVATLRAENTRLRNDAQAADEWMAMAVERMNTMGTENTALQQNVATLQAQLGQSNAAAQASGDEVSQRLAEEMETRMRLENELTQTSRQLAEERSHREQIQRQLLDAQAGVESTAKSLEQALADREKLQTDVAVLTQQLESSTDQTHSAIGSNEAELSSLRESVENLQKELSAASAELESSNQRQQEELRSRDARIQELESAQQLGGEASGTAAATADEIRARDEEIAELQEANEAAQAWMNKAVEHHQILSEQIATLTKQNTELQDQVKGLETRSQSSDSGPRAAVERLRLEMNDRDAEIKRLRDSLAEREVELQQFRSQADTLAKLEKDLLDKQTLVDAIRAESMVKDREIELLRGRMVASDLGDEYVDLTSEQESLRAELVERDERVKLLEQEVEELQAVKENLLQRIADLEATRVEFGTTEEELEALRARAAEVEARNASIEKLLNAVATEKKELELESQKNRDALEKIETELQQLRAGGDGDTTHTEQYDEKVNELQESVKTLEMRLADQQEEANGVIEQWEETYAALQKQNAETESKLQTALTEKEQLSSELTEARSALENVQSHLDNAKESGVDRVRELESTIKSLEENLAERDQEAEDTVLQWQASYNELESEYNTVSGEKEELLSRLKESQDQLKDVNAGKANGIGHDEKDDKITELNRTIQNLEEQLADQEEDSSNIVEQWQQSYDDLAKEKDDLSQQLEESQNVLEELRSQLDKSSASTGDGPAPAENNNPEPEGSPPPPEDAELESRAEVDQRVKNLEEQLADQEDAANIVQQWQESYDDLAKEKDELSQQLNEMRSRLLDLESSNKDSGQPPATAETGSHRSDFGSAVKSLDEQMASSELRDSSAANDDDVLSKLKSTIQDLRQQLEEQAEDASNTVQQWQESYEEIAAELKERTEALDAARAARSGTETNEDDATELKSGVRVLEEKLRAKEDELSTVAAQYDETCNDISNQLESTKLELEEARDAFSKLRVQFDEAVAGSVTKSGELDLQTNRVKQLEDTLLNLQEQLKDQEEDANNIVSLWQENHDRVSSQLQAVEEEKESLLSKLKQNQETLESVQAKLEERGGSEDAVAEFESTINGLEEQLKTQEEESFNTIVQWQQSYNAISEKLQAVEEEKESLLSDLKQGQDSLVSIQAKLEESERSDGMVAEFESTIKDLEEQLKTQEEEAYNTIMQWQQSYNDLSEKLEAREVELGIEREALARAQQDRSGSKSDNATAPESAADRSELEDARQARELVSDLEEKLEESRAKLEATESRLQESLDHSSKLQEQLDHAGSASLNNEIVGGGSCEDDHHRRVVQLEAMVEDLQNQLANHDEEAMDAVAQWQECYNTVAAEKEELVSDLISTQDSLNELQQQLDEQPAMAHRDAAVDDALSEKVEELTILLDRTSQEKQVLEKQIVELRRDISTRKGQIEELQHKLAASADQTPQQTPSIVSTLESRISEHMETNHRLESELLREKEDKRLLERQLADAEERINSQVESSVADLSRVKESLQSERLLDLEKMERMEQELDTMRIESASFGRERDDFKAHIAALEDEFREMNDALQLRVTNQVSDAASDLAAKLLREQIHDMRAQVHATERELESERKGRESAEADVERLRADLAALLGVEDLEENQNEIQQRIMEATETFQRTERSEIESLRTSLARAMKELADARAAENEVEERAAKAMHQAALYEQEVVSAKSDFKFLTQTMDEMRESESTRRAALEYRISSLENEQSVQQRFHSAEIENLQNELSQVNMERDRLFQALKESEKNKEALIHASSRDVPGGGDADTYAELAKLRIEKAQLLTAAAEEASRIERRLRETRAAARASAEAEIILEKELRINAEKSLESMKIELEELRVHTESLKSNKGACSEEQLAVLREELSALKEANELLTQESESLREQLEASKKESEISIQRLTEECRQAKARASHLEREGRYEAEVRAEVARLQAPLSVSRSVVVNPADDDDREDNIAVTKLYDVIQKQKQAIEEERSVYFELLTEHDGLLALLAEQDLLKASLKGALSREAGPAAVDAAIKEAEENVKAQYGKDVKLN